MCNACLNMCCGSDMFGGCGCEHCDNPECWPGDDDDFCDHEDADMDILSGRMACGACGAHWFATDDEMKRHAELAARPYPGGEKE